MVTWLKVRIFNIVEDMRVYWRYPQFRSLDRKFKDAYRWDNPYTLARKHGQVYGETPLTTLSQICKEFGITKADHVLELGSGRGRGALFLNEVIGANVTGYEMVPAFVRKGNALSDGRKVSFRMGDFLNEEFKSGSFVYLYGTCMADEEIAKLLPKIPKSAKIITVSFPLSDYNPDFKVIKKISGKYPWGSTEVYLQQWKRK